MGIQSDAEVLLAEAFDGELADAVKAFVLKQYAKGQYDPETGSLSGSSHPNTYTSRGVFANYEQVEVLNSNIEPGDVQLIVLQGELSATPKIADLVIRNADSKEFRVIGVAEDPASVIWQLQIRAVK